MNIYQSQPLKGVPIIKKGEIYEARRPPVEYGKVSDNESYAIYEGVDNDGVTHRGKITVKTQGTGNVRTNPVVTLEEVEFNE